VAGRLDALCYVPDSLVGGGDDGRLHWWDLRSARLTSYSAHEGAWLTSLAACGQYLVSAGTDGRMVAWEQHPAGPRVRSEVATRVAALSSCVLADADARIAAAHPDGGLSYWSLATA
jgi:hypothetical protein